MVELLALSMEIARASLSAVSWAAAMVVMMVVASGGVKVLTQVVWMARPLVHKMAGTRGN